MIIQFYNLNIIKKASYSFLNTLRHTYVSQAVSLELELIPCYCHHTKTDNYKRKMRTLDFNFELICIH